MATCLAKWLQDELFHYDFQRHVKAVNAMIEVRQYALHTHADAFLEKKKKDQIKVYHNEECAHL